MKLSIIIPCNDTIENMNQLQQVFDSIENQVAAADWLPETEVVVTYTNSNLRINVSKYENLKQVIKIYEIPNASTGLLKREGLEKAQGEYLIFLSPYIVFYHHALLVEIIMTLSQPTYNNELIHYYSIGQFAKDEKAYTMNNNELDTMGKIYKKDFLSLYGINFLDLNNNEDLYFSKRVQANARNINHIQSPIVIELNKQEIIDPLDSLYTEIYSINGANISELIQYQNIIDFHLKEMIYKIYRITNQIDNVKYKSMFENLLKHYLNFYLGVYKQLPPLAQVEEGYPEDFETFINRILQEEIE